ncbi:uncharacterized protein At2g39795, mitochondrial-like [Phalaenopsis equestris]|uniref:uncharacterized protein At2g39795, mitochondrial-like n=1 Tax=Phalaenopsis equestris TaxID=78828 RepID=UPI0009E5B65C|nr:uncharacterized protein At2g39795, mitochondrial-like [Phalaenopsis equestris]
MASAVLRRVRLSGSLHAGAAAARRFQIPLFAFLQPQAPNSRLSREHSSLLPFFVSSFCSTANKPTSDFDLLRVIDAEIKCADDCDDHDRVEEIPEDFPFEIQNEKGKSTVTLERSYNGEKIEVLVSMPSLVTGEEPEHDRRAGHNDEDGNRERPNQSSIPLIINARKNGGQGLEFCCTAYPDELVIDSMSFKETKDSDEEMLAYQGPDFSQVCQSI